MACSQHTAETIPARVIAAYSDAELDKYLNDHRRGNGGPTIVNVEDPENLPESFIQRLRDRAQGTTNSSRSRPIDLDQVTARLLATTNSNTSPPPALPGRRFSSTSPSNPAEVPEGEVYNKLRHLFPPFTRGSSAETLTPVPIEVLERGAYNDLVNDGGRPLYPDHLIDEVVENPFSYWDMLRPWVDYPDHPSELDRSVFHAQSLHWLGFRQWQAHNRRVGRPRPLDASSGCPDAELGYECFVRTFWRGSANYTEAAKKLLAEYDFVRPFQLHDDPKQQDTLTTWIEYLAYACAVHYQYACLVKQNQPGHDLAWDILVESKVLRPSETRENIRTFDARAQRDRETVMALRAVKTAEAALQAAQKKQASRLSQQACAQALATAQIRLDAARSELESLRNRSHHFGNFADAMRTYRSARMDMIKSNVKLQWILEQVPLVEAELKEAGTAQSGSQTGRSTKRERNHADEVTDSGSIKQLYKTSCNIVIKPTPANESSATPMSSTARARTSSVKTGSDRPKRAPEAPKIQSTRRSRRLAGQDPELGLDGNAIEDAKPQTILRSGKMRTGGVVSRARLGD